VHLPPHETWGSCPLACWFMLSTANHCSIIRQMSTIIRWAETSCNTTSQLVFPVQGLRTSIRNVWDSWTFSFPQLNNMSCSPMGRMSRKFLVADCSYDHVSMLVHWTIGVFSGMVLHRIYINSPRSLISSQPTNQFDRLLLTACTLWTPPLW